METSNFFKDNKLDFLLKKLNVCYNPFRQWEDRRAQRKHIDLFGFEIKEGEIYYRLSIDQYLSNDVKLSKENMERFIYLIFVNRPNWETDSENEIQKQFDKVREIMNKIIK